MKIRTVLPVLWLVLVSLSAAGQRVDYSVVSVPSESGLNLVKVTSDNDRVAMPLVRRTHAGANWTTNTILGVSPDGSRLGYVSVREGISNLFIKDLNRQGPSVQRTKRAAVVDFSFSPDGKRIVFSEKIGRSNQVFLTDSEQGFICRQITGDSQDFSPVFNSDMSKIFFCRQDLQGLSLWSFDLKDNFLTTYCEGMNPYMDDIETVICTRVNAAGRGEIWRIDVTTGVEECLLSDPNRSFSSPVVSPDGSKIVLVGSNGLQNGSRLYWNTDIFVCHADGTGLTQLTFHAADDVSPVWDAEGTQVYFISQRGSQDAVANVWRMDCPVF